MQKIILSGVVTSCNPVKSFRAEALVFYLSSWPQHNG